MIYIKSTVSYDIININKISNIFKLNKIETDKTYYDDTDKKVYGIPHCLHMKQLLYSSSP